MARAKSLVCLGLSTATAIPTAASAAATGRSRPLLASRITRDGVRVFKPAEEFVEPLLIVGYDEGLSCREEGHVQMSFGEVDADVGTSWKTIQLLAPFLPAPNLAGAGSEASPTTQVTVRAPLEVLEGHDKPIFPTASKEPRRIRSVAPAPSDCRPKPKHKEIDP